MYLGWYFVEFFGFGYCNCIKVVGRACGFSVYAVVMFWVILSFCVYWYPATFGCFWVVGWLYSAVFGGCVVVRFSWIVCGWYFMV